MTENTKQAVIEALDQIPPEQLPELYDIIHQFRLGFEQYRSRASQILQLAGSWCDMPDEEFTAFLAELTPYRLSTFSGEQ